MKLLCLGTYPVESAAVRYRVLQFFPHLRSQGIEATYRPFMDSRFFTRFYTPHRKVDKALRLMRFMLRRSAEVARARDFDAVLVHREIALMGPPWIERGIARLAKKPMVFDFDDAIQIALPSPVYGKAATWLKYPQKTPQIIRMSHSVIAGNHHLEEYAHTLGARVTVIPTVMDEGIVRPRPFDAAPNKKLVLGWMGTHSTLPYLESLFPVLQQLAKRYDFLVRIIGGGRPVQVPGVEVDNRAWTLNGEVSDLQSFDIGLYPIIEDAWSLGKSGFKAIQYMAVGIPVVCSPVGATCDIVKDGVHGFLPISDEQWIERLSQLLEDAQLRQSLGEAGRARVEEWYCLAQQAPRFAQVVRETMS